MRLAVTLIAILFSSGFAYAQQSIENPRHGYTMDIPGDWHEVPNEFLAEFSQSVSSPEQPINYVGGYQREPFDDALVYPYILVQSIAYRDFGLNRPPTRDEMGTVVESIVGIDIVDAVADTPAADIAEVIEDKPPVKLISLDDETGEFIYDLNIAIATVGNVQGRARGVFGRRALVQTAYYTLESDWPQIDEQANTVLSSFKFLPGYTYSIPENKIPEKTTTSWALITIGILGAAFVLGAILLVVRAANQST